VTFQASAEFLLNFTGIWPLFNDKIYARMRKERMTKIWEGEGILIG